MAKRIKKKKMPKIDKMIGQVRTATITTDDYEFDIKYKVQGASKTLGLSAAIGQDDDGKGTSVDSMKLGDVMLDMIAESIQEWDLEYDISSSTIDALPADVVVQIFQTIQSGAEQEKN